MSIGVWQLVLILVIIIIFFGAGKLPNMMGDLGKGIKNMKDGLKGEDKKDEASKLEKKDDDKKGE